MNWIAFIVLLLAAGAALMAWYIDTPKRFASSKLALALLIIGIILAAVLAELHPIIRVHSN